MAKKLIILVALFTVVAVAAPLAAQQATPPAAPPPTADVGGRPLGAGEVQQLFEAWTVLQAQTALQLSDEQYGRFVTQFKGLQDVRRRHQIARNRILADLRQLTNPQRGAGTDAAIAERLKALRAEDDQAAADIRKAYDAVDQTLDTRQQARLRVFEERMEQRKLELLMRARQNARPPRARGK